MDHPLRADCHCHTHFSDGALSVDALLYMAKSLNLTGISITDHDTVEAYRTAIPLAKTLGLSLVSGIELSAQHRNTSIHVLGYAFDWQHPMLVALCEQQQKSRHQRNVEILDKLSQLKFTITMEELMSAFPFRSLGRPHIAQLMVKKGYVPSIKTAFERYLGDKKRCYVGGFDLSVPEAIRIIREAGGYAVLAHPYVIQPARIVDDLLAMPFDGIEVFYGTMHRGREQIYVDHAKKHQWLMTGGSDFHGEHKSYPRLGTSFSPPETFALFEARFEKNSRQMNVAILS